jgi:hypothetical protein
MTPTDPTINYHLPQAIHKFQHCCSAPITPFDILDSSTRSRKLEADLTLSTYLRIFAPFGNSSGFHVATIESREISKHLALTQLKVDRNGTEEEGRKEAG